MDQDAFRSLLTTPGATASSNRSATQPAPSAKHGKKSTTSAAADASSSKTAFKPRKVAKKDLPPGYRDRASERRAGVNDYADVETVLDNFEKQAANTEDKSAVEEQRKYLGGDEKHTVLVKGLDFALLEQAKSRSGGGQADDDALEEAFLEAATPATTVSKKRTREELLQELKRKRDAPSASEPDAEEPEVPPAEKSLEKAKQMGKFKPIGAPTDSKAKAKEDKKKKKKRKIAEEGSAAKTSTTQSVAESSKAISTPKADALPPSEPTSTSAAKQPPPPKKPLTPSPAPSDPNEELDIFADAGAYEGVDLGDDDEEIEDGAHKPAPSRQPDDGPSKPKVVNWFSDPVPEPEPEPTPPPPAEPEPQAQAEEGEDDQPMRLQPLASSSIRSVKEFLENDKELEKAEKRKARKEKNKAKNK